MKIYGSGLKFPVSVTSLFSTGSMGFDFEGEYTNIVNNEFIKYKLGDGRKVSVIFQKSNEGIKITEIFEAEDKNSIEIQKQGWQSILNNFKKYVESQ